jgi:hypothetical protein
MNRGLLLSLLYFESIDNGDDTHTLEAMASVPPARVSDVLAEVASVLAWAQQHFPNGPQPLDDGGQWDAWLQWQADDGAVQTLPLPDPLHTGPVGGAEAPQAFPLDASWLTFTLTLVLPSASVSMPWAE